MSHEIVGATNRGAGRRFAIIAAQFHEQLTRPLVDGALETLRTARVADDDITVVWTPGSFELPTAAAVLAQSRRYDAIICLGVVIRGETPHFDYVAGEAARGIAEVGRTTGVPTIFGVVTADSLEQAVARAGGRHGNRGADAARTALAMADVMAQIWQRRDDSRMTRRKTRTRADGWRKSRGLPHRQPAGRSTATRPDPQTAYRPRTAGGGDWRQDPSARRRRTSSSVPT